MAAAGGDGGSQEMLIVMDSQGGMRMLEAAGWSLPALSAEFGASAVYKIQRRTGTVRVEGLAGSQRCLLQKQINPVRLSDLPGMAPTIYPTMLQLPSLALACSNDRAPQVRNS